MASCGAITYVATAQFVSLQSLHLPVSLCSLHSCTLLTLASWSWLVIVNAFRTEFAMWLTDLCGLGQGLMEEKPSHR